MLVKVMLLVVLSMALDGAQEPSRRVCLVHELNDTLIVLQQHI